MTNLLILNLLETIMGQSGEKFSTAVTLFVGGTIISGDMIHPYAYLNAMADLMTLPTGDPKSIESGRIISKMIKSTIEEAKSVSPPKITSKEIYIKNAKIWNLEQTSTPIVNKLVALRIEGIDGFMLGYLSPLNA